MANKIEKPRKLEPTHGYEYENGVNNMHDRFTAWLQQQGEKLKEELPEMLAKAQKETIPNSAIYDIDVKKLRELLCQHFGIERK